MNRTLCYTVFLALVVQAAVKLGSELGIDQPRNGCSRNCANGGQCARTDSGTEYCECQRGWTGEECSQCTGRVEMQASSSVQRIFDGAGNYSSHPESKCSWLVTAEHDELGSPLPIQINITFFETECGWDHLYIYDGTSAIESTLLATLCGITSNPPLLYAKSGHAFLHFYSDMAYNMSGFDMTLQSIPIIPTLPLPIPPLEVQTSFGSLIEDKTLLPEDMTPRAMASVARKGAKLFIWGGYQFPSQNDRDLSTWLVDLDQTIEPKQLDFEASPPIRYGAPMTIFKEDRAIIYGGSGFDDHYIFNDIWVFDTSKAIGWTQAKSIPFIHDDPSELVHLSGHSMVTVKFENETELILSFGGYAGELGFVSLVIELRPVADHIDQFSFLYPETLGFRVPGSFGHSAVVDPQNPRYVYLYGGFQNNMVRKELVIYESISRTFTQLKSAPGSPRWYHSGGIVNRHLVFMAGNTHTDTDHSSGSLCYSNEILLYSIECGKWSLLETETKWFPRYGAASLSYLDKVFMIGGFDGELKSDAIAFKPNELANECSVVTRTNDGVCQPPEHPIAQTADCSSCVYENSMRDDGCVYCAADSSPSVTPRDSCGAKPEKGYKSSYVCYEDVQSCPDFEQWTCRMSHKRCASCITSGCSFVVKSDSTSSVKHYSCVLPNTLVNNTDITEHTSIGTCLKGSDSKLYECGAFTNCTDCVADNSSCMWCGSLGVCVSNESYVTAFPFGQCFEWFQHKNCEKTSCTGHQTCKSCQSDPRCGWCDDGSQTGSGTCMVGSLDAPAGRETCPGSNNWFWGNCPRCNCSGHSKCDRLDPGLCLNCAEKNTVGANCERCAEGYYGNALNRGKCQECNCSKHGRTCDNLTGKCLCTTKGISGMKCDECDVGSKYWGDPSLSSCFYNITNDFAYSFRLNHKQDTEVTALNCHVIQLKEEPDIKIEVKIDTDGTDGPIHTNKSFMVNVTTFLPGEKEELINGSISATDKYILHVSHKKYGFGNSTNRAMRIYIHNFTTPIFIKVQVMQHNRMSLLTFFLVFFACFLSLLLLAVIVWKLKTMYDLYLQRRAVMNEMREMAARPFAQVHLATEKPLLNDPPQPVCYEVLEDHSAAVATVFLLLPRHADGSPPVGLSSLCFGSVMIAFDEKSEQDLLLPVLPPTSIDGVDNPTCTEISSPT